MADFQTLGLAAVGVLLGCVAIATVVFLCSRLAPASRSHRQISDIDLEERLAEIPDDLKVARLNEMRHHWETSKTIVAKDLPRLAKKLSMAVGGVDVLRKGKIVSESQRDIDKYEAVGNVLWQLATYGNQLAEATDVAPVNEPQRSRFTPQDQASMVEVVQAHDLNSFPLRVARAINQQVIAPAFAFLFHVVDVPPEYKPFLDARNAQSWTVEIELPPIAEEEGDNDSAAPKRKTRMSTMELMADSGEADYGPNASSSHVASENAANAPSSGVVIRHLRQSRCCLPPTEPNFFYFNWIIEIHLNADASEFLDSFIVVKEVFNEGGTDEHKKYLDRMFRIGQRL